MCLCPVRFGSLDRVWLEFKFKNLSFGSGQIKPAERELNTRARTSLSRATWPSFHSAHIQTKLIRCDVAFFSFLFLFLFHRPDSGFQLELTCEWRAGIWPREELLHEFKSSFRDQKASQSKAWNHYESQVRVVVVVDSHPASNTSLASSMTYLAPFRALHLDVGWLVGWFVREGEKVKELLELHKQQQEPLLLPF